MDLNSQPVTEDGMIFTAEEIQGLESDHILQPGHVNGIATGIYKVLTALLSPPSIAPVRVSNSSSNSSTTASVRFNTHSDSRSCNQVGSFDLPIDAESVEVLEFLGFTRSTATEIYNRYITRPDPRNCPDDILAYAFGQVCVLNSHMPAWIDMSPSQAMDAVGLNAEIQAAILDPQFNGLLLSHNLRYWVEETLKLRYQTLWHLQDRLKTHVTLRGEGKGGTSLEEVSATPNIRGANPLLPTNHISIVAEEPGASLPDHTTLYKATAASGMYYTDPWICPDGSLNMQVLQSCPGGDFNCHGCAHYWTPDKEAAEQYRLWAARRDPLSETWLIRIHVPNAFLATLTVKELWYSPDWKEYVWHCKRWRHPPSKFDALSRPPPVGPDLLCGHICIGKDTAITEIKLENVQTEVTEDCVLRLGSSNSKATQWAFLTCTSYVGLGEVIRGKIHITVFEPSYDK